MNNNKKTLKKILFLIITGPPSLFFWFLIITSFVTHTNITISPQLSEQTVLSLCDNLSNLAITGNSNFKDNRFHLVFCDNQNKSGCYYNFDLFQNKAIAYITYKGIFSKYVDVSSIKFYYDTIDNCTRYYEISYNKESNKALCIDEEISRTNPFSATIIRTNK
ncbi:hypothetical protein [Mucispirillum schaedleri]|jgi:hypothetical protein|uniref:Uncharacterized protein n=1 Tax=Mucispirillum schaedleri ASF457 TaxID=1379858 RepID=V2QH15_9BACT|nr:hypothetical protein [Mucispirillum schaedleri]MCX4361747.1 hypothetical protein [Mucispirillum schaedleri]USF23625.1 hypothetical protein N508_000690 [Mucispirillum schaedleri ASF457]SIW08134.1 conserved hypothetical protein [Mucispirillum schaedleri ASF457]